MIARGSFPQATGKPDPLQDSNSVSRMDTILKISEDGQDTSNDIHEAQVVQAAETRDHITRRNRKFDDKHPPITVAPTRLLSDNGICAKCAELDLGGALQKAVCTRQHDKTTYKTEPWHGIHVTNLGHQYQHHPMANCALCSILCACRIDPEQNPFATENGDEIRFFGFQQNSHLIPYQQRFQDDSGFLVVVPARFGSNKGEKSDYCLLRDHVLNEGATVILQDGGDLARSAAQGVLDPFNATTASLWLENCKTKHSFRCGGSTKSAVSGLRLIDCTTLTIREAESESPFVALSYVWGNPGNVDTTRRRTRNGRLLRKRLSPVIIDAICVTKTLGFQYLWVDKFCIDQNDAATKHEQIKQMGAIYENAELTIIAAAGADETHGLPGAGKRPATPQNIARFGGMSVIPMMKHPHSSIRSSRWASRGWTFQEAVLSRRRLVFTGDHLYFECNSMNRFQSVYNLELEDDYEPSTGDDLGSVGGARAGLFGKPDPSAFDPPGVFQQYLRAIEDYSPRELSYDADSLNAFQGIIQWYSKLKHPFNAIWGMPYPVHRRRSLCFCFALAWSHTQSCWENARRPRRRPEFPSWTWAGWAGAVQIQSRVGELRSIENGMESIRFGDRSDEEEDLGQLKSTTPESKCRVLRLLGKALPPRLFSCEPAEDGKTRWMFAEYKTTLFPSRQSMLGAQFPQEFMDSARWRCVWISSNAELGVSYCMALELNHDTGRWIRAGMFRIRCSDQEIRLKTYNVDATWSEIE